MDFVNPGAPRLWSMNGVMNGRNTYHHAGWNEGTLSIKFIVKGEGTWISDEGRFKLSGDQFLILNQGQRYGLHIKSPMLVETFCVFFKPGFIESVLRQNSAGLDQPPEWAPLEFPTRLEPYDSIVVPELLAFRKLVQAGAHLERGTIEDSFIRLAEVLLSHHRLLKPAVDSSATSQEIDRRLARARDFMLCNLGVNIGLEEIASEAFLSPFHFHRLFKRRFGETPHGFLTRLRVEKASRMLVADIAPSLVCAELGFSSYASFSHLMLKTTGRRPSVVGRQAQDSTSTLL